MILALLIFGLLLLAARCKAPRRIEHTKVTATPERPAQIEWGCTNGCALCLTHVLPAKK